MSDKTIPPTDGVNSGKKLPLGHVSNSYSLHSTISSSFSSSSTCDPTSMLLAANHLTNSGAVVDVVRIDYGEAMRSYRVCRQGPIGYSADSISPLFLLFGVNDVFLLAISVVLSLGFFSTFTGHRHVDRFSQWLQRGEEHLDSRFPNTFLGVALFTSALLFLIRFWRAFSRVYVEEALVIRGLGIQLTHYSAFGRKKWQRFIDLRLIRSLVIHDAYFRYQPIFFLSSSIENEEKRLVYFEETLPRLSVLQPVLCGLRHILYGEPEKGLTLSELELKRTDKPDGVDVEEGDLTGIDETTANSSEHTLSDTSLQDGDGENESIEG